LKTKNKDFRNKDPRFLKKINEIKKKVRAALRKENKRKLKFSRSYGPKRSI